MSFPRNVIRDSISNGGESNKKRERSQVVSSERSAKKSTTAVDRDISSIVRNKIVTLSLNQYAAGNLALGYVLQVAASHLVVSLPGGVIGTVSLNDISDIPPISDSEDAESNTSATVASSVFSPVLSLVKPFQPVLCVVTTKDNKVTPKKNNKTESSTSKQMQQIRLSMRGSHVNRYVTHGNIQRGCFLTGCIQSVEDHGYLIYTGIGQITAFLPMKNVPASLGELSVGQPIICSVAAYNADSKFVTVTIFDPSSGTDTSALIADATRQSSSKGGKKLAKELMTASAGDHLSFHSLLPGVLLQVTVTKVLDNGLLVKVLESFTGVIDASSIDTYEATKEWQSHMSESDLIYARIVFLDHSTKTIRLSYRPHIIDMHAPSSLPALGETIHDLRVYQVMRKTGIYLVADSAAETDSSSSTSSSSHHHKPSCCVFMHKSNLSSITADVDADAVDSAKMDEGVNEDNIHTLYASTVVPKARVLGYHLVEGFVIASNRIRHLQSSTVTHWSHIKLGEVYQATVTAVADVGLSLTIQGKIHAFCPAIHTSDVVNLSSLKLPAKFKVGNKIKVRVWQVKKNGSVIVTHKKSFVDDSHDNIFSHRDMSVGKLGMGCITRVHSDEGLRIHFYNGMRGFIPRQVLLKQGVSDVSESYRVGQVLKCVFLGKYRSKDIAYKATKGDEGAREIIFLALNLGEPEEILSSLADEISRLVGDADNLLLLQQHAADNTDERSNRKRKSHDNEEDEDDNEDDGDEDDDHRLHGHDQGGDSDDSSSMDQESGPRLVSGVLSKIEESALRVALDNGSVGTIRMHHCFDFMATAEALFESRNFFVSDVLKVGTRLEHLVVLQDNRKTLQLSAKPLLCRVAMARKGIHHNNYAGAVLLAALRKIHGEDVIDNFTSSDDNGDSGHGVDHINEEVTQRDVEMSIPSKVSDLVPGQLVAGCVHKVEEFGVLVKFLEDLVALIPRPNIANHFVSNPVGMFTVGDSIRCVVQRVDQEQGRVILTTKTAFVNSYAPFLENQLWEKAMLVEVQTNTPNVSTETAAVVSHVKSLKSPVWSFCSLGSVVEAIVTSIEGDASAKLKTKVNNQQIVLYAPAQHSETKLVIGGSVSVRVVDVNFESNSLVVSTSPYLLEQGASSESTAVSKSAKKKQENKQKVSFKLGTRLDVRIELLGSGYLVGSVNSGRDLVLVSLADYHCPYTLASEFKLHSTIQAKVAHVNSQVMPGYPYSAFPILVTVPSSHLQTDLTSGSLRHVHDSSNYSENSEGEFLSNLRIGRLMSWRIKEIGSTEIVLSPDSKYNAPPTLLNTLRAVVHVTSAIDSRSGVDDLEETLESSKKFLKHKKASSNSIHPGHPFAGLSIGQNIECKILQVRNEDTENDGEGETHVIEDQAKYSHKLHVYLAMQQHANNSEISLRMIQWHGRNTVKSSALYPVVVTEIGSDVHSSFYCTVHLSPYVFARLHFMDVSTNKKLVKKFAQYCFVGQRLVVATMLLNGSSNTKKVLHVSRAQVETVYASLSSTLQLSPPPTVQLPPVIKLVPGAKVSGLLDLKASKHTKNSPALLLSLGSHYPLGARVSLCEVDDRGNWSDYSTTGIFNTDDDETAEEEEEDVPLSLPDGRQAGTLVKGVVLSVSKDRVEVSLRPSRLECQDKAEAVQPDEFPEPGSIVQGYITAVSHKGCFVRLSSVLTGIVYLKDLSDEFVKNPAEEFPVGKLVNARVVSCNPEQLSAKLSLKNSDVAGYELMKVQLAKLNIGDTVVGTVEKIMHFGVFVKIQNTSIVGLSRKHFAVADESVDMSKVYAVGDVVRAKVLSISLSKVSLGLRESCFAGDKDKLDKTDDEANDDEEEEEEEEEEEAEEFEDVNVDNDDDEVDEDEGEDEGEEQEEEEEEEEDDEEDSNDIVLKPSPVTAAAAAVMRPSTKKQKHNRLLDEQPADNEDEDEEEEEDNQVSLSTPFQWGDFSVPSSSSAAAAATLLEDDEEEEDDEEDDEDNMNVQSSGGKGKHKGKEHLTEVSIRKREAELLNVSLVPERVEDFERMLIAQPNASFAWIQYMAHYLKHFDVRAAREVCERALKTINFREEEEKFNVWVAYLSLEYKFGSAVSLEETFKRGVAESKGKYLHMKLADMYEASDQIKQAEDMYEKTLKKYKYSKKVWSAYQLFRLRQKDEEKAKQLLARSLQSLSRHKHVEVIQKYAIAEFEIGSTERGRVVFENQLSNYPNRVDLWHVYVDKETKSGHVAQARQLFDRMITLKTSAHNLKTIFKKYLNFEILHGTPETQDAVKQKARDYVTSHM